MMAVKEIRISIEDFNNDKVPEVLLEFYDKKKELEFSTSVSASKKKGVYDKVDVKGDADGDGDFDPADDKKFIRLAAAAAEMLK
ncbi:MULTISPECIES: hypothetical protein [Pseudomonas]|jgi:hypothetical protein|uniref:Uncharacterized protein n=2 Tax=Pseudomonas fluorescens group TaxID=136843 RepID=A0AB36D3Z1_9PSED|nr:MULTISPECIES: hypothetical protein [Pseudomonas]MBA4359713.1 hypothetical protein [Pseudomonas sp.]MSU95238.1 hypothetical protein [Pseudomonas mandelii]NMZ82773.1 hypothetical protein [Pseudomonas mandelii]PMV87522.1 hypothetical protein C1X56_10685 [Pseudomonas sp. GW101-1A09]PMV94311.1 hypothetical protein C1X51_13015 [Pseudomonas sp. FW306-2-2C-B10A]